ncbi:MAG: hypothetical protein HQL18_05145 [Candidatus Omnitrophica bacterium]|nr:hypothetical protein [Candidatus Omnitrophota bacterium]
MTKEKKDLLFFGYGLGVIAAVFALLGTRRHGFGLPQKVELACAVLFVLVTAIRWEALKPGYKGWMKVAHLIGGVISTLILGVVFFLVFTPVGLLFRIIGKDHLERKIDKAASSYWHRRSRKESPREKYLNQF